MSASINMSSADSSRTGSPMSEESADVEVTNAAKRIESAIEGLESCVRLLQKNSTFRDVNSFKNTLDRHSNAIQRVYEEVCPDDVVEEPEIIASLMDRVDVINQTLIRFGLGSLT